MHETQRKHAGPQVHQRLLGLRVRYPESLHLQEAVDDLKVVFHAMVNLPEQQVPLFKRAGPLYEKPLEVNLCLLQFRLRPSALADVSKNLRGSHDCPVRAPNRRNGDRRREFCPVLPASHGLEVFDPFAALDPMDDKLFLSNAVRGKKNVDRSTDHLVSRIAEDFLSSPIPALDYSGKILPDDRIAGRIDDRRKVGRIIVTIL